MANEKNYIETAACLGKPAISFPNIARALKSSTCSLFIGNIMYWEPKSKNPERWIYKTQAEITQEAGLTRTEQENARKKLRNFGILEEKKEGLPCKIYYRLNSDRLNYILEEFFNGRDVVKIEKAIAKKKAEPAEKLELTSPPVAMVPKTVLWDMRAEFDKRYLKLTEGIEFNWGVGKTNNGKDWGNLRRLKVLFEERLVKMNKENPSYAPTGPEVLNSWIMFLDNLPQFHVDRNFTPSLLYSNFSKIILEIKQGNASNKKDRRTPTGSDAINYV